jgi:hypothetical protein
MLHRIERVPASFMLHHIPVLGWSAGSGSFRPTTLPFAKTRGREWERDGERGSVPLNSVLDAQRSLFELETYSSRI